MAVAQSATMETLVAKILVSLNLIFVALAALPSNNIAITPEIARQGQILGVYGAIYKHFGPDKVEMALKIAFAESKLDPKAVNRRSTAKGIFQILDGTARQYSCEGSMLEIEPNVKCATRIAEDGWGAWEASEFYWR